MQGNTTIDLGIYGQMTMDSWITGLQTGTLSFDTVFQFFQQQVKNGVNVDTTQEGQNNIQTLINGMQIGALSIPQVAQTMGLDIKSNVQVDLGNLDNLMCRHSFKECRMDLLMLNLRRKQ